MLHAADTARRSATNGKMELYDAGVFGNTRIGRERTLPLWQDGHWLSPLRGLSSVYTTSSPLKTHTHNVDYLASIHVVRRKEKRGGSVADLVRFIRVLHCYPRSHFTCLPICLPAISAYTHFLFSTSFFLIQSPLEPLRFLFIFRPKRVFSV